MAIIRVSKQPNQFSIIDRTAAEDSTLSYKAKGIMFYLLTKPDNWTVHVADLVKTSTDGRDSVYAGLNELKDAGYITVIKQRGRNGKFTDYEYIVHENPVQPLTENPYTAEKPPLTENPYTEKPDTEKPEGSNTDFNDNNLEEEEEEESPISVFFEVASKNKISYKLAHELHSAILVEGDVFTKDELHAAMKKLKNRIDLKKITTPVTWFVATLKNQKLVEK